MTKTRILCSAALVLGLTTLATGCFLKKEEGRHRTILKAGWQVGEDMGGWFAVAPNAPKETVSSEKSLTYYVLKTHDVVPEKLEGWFAMNPALFEKATGIKLAPGATPLGEMWEMRIGRRVPKEKDGWIGMAVTYPRLHKEGEYQLAVLSADMLTPKEMDGWAVVNREDAARLGQERQMSLVTESDKAPIPDAGALKGKEIKPEPAKVPEKL